jgi:ribosomal protein L23
MTQQNKALVCLSKVNPLYRNTEKSTKNKEDLGKHHFTIGLTATKHDVKHALEDLFGKDKIASVNIIRRKGKKVVFKGKRGSKSDYKIAIVT